MYKIIFILIVCLLVSSITSCFHNDDNSNLLNSTPKYSGFVTHAKQERDKTPQVKPPELQQQISNNNEFAFNLYNYLKNHENLGNKNIVYSPLSISLSMAMLSAGAKGETLDQINQSLHFNPNQTVLHPLYNKLSLHYENLNRGKINLFINNELWGQQDFSFEQTFLDTLAVNYGTRMNLVDFFAAPEESRVTINNWISEQTQQKIKKAIPQGFITGDTRLLMTNTIYFDADWSDPFDPDMTTNEIFNLVDGQEIVIPFMGGKKRMLNSYNTPELVAVELEYLDNNLSMVFIMPKEQTIHDFENRFNQQIFANILGNFQLSELVLVLPKFEYNTELPLSSGLKSLGVNNAFIPSLADFSGINSSELLYVGGALQKAYISVDERGTEAGSATAIAVNLVSAPLVINLNRPFFFIVHDKELNNILFMGRVLDPRSN